MDCRKAQEQILESLAEPRAGANTPDLDTHLAGCEACRSFSETQFMLDLQLSAAISVPPLSAAFRTSLAKRIRREPLSLAERAFRIVNPCLGDQSEHGMAAQSEARGNGHK